MIGEVWKDTWGYRLSVNAKNVNTEQCSKSDLRLTSTNMANEEDSIPHLLVLGSYPGCHLKSVRLELRVLFALQSSNIITLVMDRDQKKKRLKINAAEPENTSLPKHFTYIIHNATQPQTIWSEIWMYNAGRC